MIRLPGVSVIILNYNGIDDTISCLKSLLKTDYPDFEILVLDNGSASNEAKIIQRNINSKKLKIFRIGQNLGFTGGNNWLVKYVKKKYFVLLNNDTLVNKYWLKRLVSFAKNKKDGAVYQPKIKLSYDQKRFDYAGACGGYIDYFGYPFTRGRIFESREIDRGQYDDPTRIFWASGAAMLIRKSILEEEGYLFDNDFFNYMEEIDFCWRLMNKGYKIYSVPQSVVYHKVAGSAGKNLLKKRYWEHRNNILLMIKNLEKTDLLIFLTIRPLFELLTYLNYIMQLKFKFVASLFLAHLTLFYMIPKFIKKRTGNYKKLSELPVFKGSIVVSYFIENKKTFKSLGFDSESDL
ncbi:hypothetical protein A2961_01090 [Candidatus Woesebacteria bacterium RIFCSPLOWO2_01_FULL_39_21]|uniref:Glycosyltransferase 2-like domain-containing protein n=1 Tax=Candidatus Woesebacteria bacterium RIFCSPLOWO2_01_FULL_39_21 TaxID=1802519 RepID=A0A1F8BHK2_9BACT|nr:MAG: hypothetical protein A2691_00160 [Candidatus Woesebacteria bacterium RIFCSPHIGHO2_01_FULL_39_23]OGM63544.1 MAG: hypothetical protein A2961_01090 [Candidatus Woesebacteria bacterium RIFCSPLOWO2_01_FULL_39_21]